MLYPTQDKLAVPVLFGIYRSIFKTNFFHVVSQVAMWAPNVNELWHSYSIPMYIDPHFSM